MDKLSPLPRPVVSRVGTGSSVSTGGFQRRSSFKDFRSVLRAAGWLGPSLRGTSLDMRSFVARPMRDGFLVGAMSFVGAVVMICGATRGLGSVSQSTSGRQHPRRLTLRHWRESLGLLLRSKRQLRVRGVAETEHGEPLLSVDILLSWGGVGAAGGRRSALLPRNSIAVGMTEIVVIVEVQLQDRGSIAGGKRGAVGLSWHRGYVDLCAGGQDHGAASHVTLASHVGASSKERHLGEWSQRR